MQTTSVLISGSRQATLSLRWSFISHGQSGRLRAFCLEAAHFIYSTSVTPNHVRKLGDCRARWLSAPIGSQCCTGVRICRISSAWGYLLWKETQLSRACELHGHVTRHDGDQPLLSLHMFCVIHHICATRSPGLRSLQSAAVWIVVEWWRCQQVKKPLACGPFPPWAASCWHGDELQSSLTPSLTALRSDCWQERSHFVPNFTLKRNVKDNVKVISLHVRPLLQFLSNLSWECDFVLIPLVYYLHSPVSDDNVFKTHSCSRWAISLHLLCGGYFFRRKVDGLSVGKIGSNETFLLF